MIDVYMIEFMIESEGALFFEPFHRMCLGRAVSMALKLVKSKCFTCYWHGHERGDNE